MVDNLRPTVAEIDLNALTFNLKEISRKVSPAKIMAVVKADAYGHGAIPVAKHALKHGAEYLGVAIVEEGIELRKAGIRAPILVFGGAMEDQLRLFVEYHLTPTIYTRNCAEFLSMIGQNLNKKISVHIKIDTGMGRVGVPYGDAVEFIEFAQNLPGIEIEGVYTHFATSDEKDKGYALSQFAKFEAILRSLNDKGIKIALRHCANSGAILDLPHTYLDLVRPGVMMYGYYPSDETSESVPIQPLMTLKTRVLFIKKVPENTSLSYGRKFITKKPTRIATLPVGYADGYNRLLTNKAHVTIRGKKFPVVGRVCMDLILVDLGNDDQIEMGDEVILFGSGENDFSVKDYCKIVDTIPYEVTCWVSKRVPRVYKH
ncbi:MAG: alanine racemase [Calditrichaeota bacterium]|nr:MAG: alanine racemase [Calditrichota bacterium]